MALMHRPENKHYEYVVVNVYINNISKNYWFVG